MDHVIPPANPTSVDIFEEYASTHITLILILEDVIPLILAKRALDFDDIAWSMGCRGVKLQLLTQD